MRRKAGFEPALHGIESFRRGVIPSGLACAGQGSAATGNEFHLDLAALRGFDGGLLDELRQRFPVVQDTFDLVPHIGRDTHRGQLGSLHARQCSAFAMQKLSQKMQPPLSSMDKIIRAFFERYESLFMQALRGDVDMDEVASMYAPEFIAASPAGVMAGRNDKQLKQVMAQGYARYRAIGTQAMRLRGVRFSPMDDHHGVARVAWTAVYARPDHPDVAIDFEVHYLVQVLDGAQPQVFGWVSGDEQALLRQHGIIADAH